MKRVHKVGVALGGITTFLVGCDNKEATSIGIIGGADGPTAICIATSPKDIGFMIGTRIIVIGVVVMFLYSRKKKK